MASWLMRMVSSSGKSSRKRRAICSGLQAVAQRRSCRRPRRRPFHGTTGPCTAAPFGAMMTPASRSCTERRSGSLIASLADFGRRAERSACHCAVVARYARPPLRVAALRRSSREMVDGARSSRRAISRTPCRCARQMAISSRSANDRERPDSGFADGARWDGGMPPALRNQRAPTAGATPAPTAASSLEHPAAMAAQNRWRSSRRATEGRPGEGKAPRPDRSERRFRTVIATSSLKVLRRPLEPGENVLDLYAEPPDPKYPVVCLDESPVQLIGEVREPIPAAPGQIERVDYEYRRCGTVNLFVAVDAHRPWRKVSVTERRTAQDYAERLRELVDVDFPDATCIRVVQDNLSTHTPGSLYETFPAAEAHRIRERLEFHYTPKHASWLNMVEIEIGVLKGQCLDRRIDHHAELEREIATWEHDRNARGARVNWMFTTEKARAKMGRAYPKPNAALDHPAKQS